MLYRLLTITLLALILLHPQTAHAEKMSRWLDELTSTLRSALPHSAADDVIRAADLYKKASSPASGKPFDVVAIQDMLKSNVFTTKCFEVLNDAMKRESQLEDGRKLTESAVLSKDHVVRTQATQDYYFLKCRFRIMVAIARMGVGQKMASYAGRSYASQAVESAIDALRDAAVMSEKYDSRSASLGTDNPPTEKIKACRSSLLEIWDASQKNADVAPLLNMDTRSLVEDLLLKPSKTEKIDNDRAQCQKEPLK